MQTLISCPGCGVPAEIAEHFSLPSTEGPVDHVVVDCVAGHHFRMAADRLPAQRPASQQPTSRPGQAMLAAWMCRSAPMVALSPGCQRYRASEFQNVKNTW